MQFISLSLCTVLCYPSGRFKVSLGTLTYVANCNSILCRASQVNSGFAGLFNPIVSNKRSLRKPRGPIFQQTGRTRALVPLPAGVAHVLFDTAAHLPVTRVV